MMNDTSTSETLGSFGITLMEPQLTIEPETHTAENGQPTKGWEQPLTLHKAEVHKSNFLGMTSS